MRKLAYDRASFVAALLVTAACGSGSSSSTGAQANGDSGGGFDSAVACVADALDRLHTTATSHRRVMVI